MNLHVTRISQIDPDVGSEVGDYALLYVCVTHVALCPPADRCFYIWTCTLSKLTAIYARKDAPFFIANGFIGTYNFNIIEQEINRVLQKCDANTSLCETAICLDAHFDNLEGNGRYDPWINEQPSENQSDYAVREVTLLNMPLEAVDAACCNVFVQVKAQHKTTATQQQYVLQIITLGWLEKKLPINQILYVQRALIVKVLDLAFIKASLNGLS